MPLQESWLQTQTPSETKEPNIHRIRNSGQTRKKQILKHQETTDKPQPQAEWKKT